MTQLVLFEPEPATPPLRAALLDRFREQTIPIEMIEQFVVEDTDYLTTHYRKVLKSLENENLVTCMSNRSRRGTYPPRTVLRFS